MNNSERDGAELGLGAHQATSRRDLLRLGSTALGAGLAATGLGACATVGASAAPRGGPHGLVDAPQPSGSELYPELSDASHQVAPIAPAEYAGRRARLGRLLQAAGEEALLVESGATLTYLSGVTWGQSERLFALVVLADGSHFWIVPAFEESRARLQIDAADGPGGQLATWLEHEYAFEPSVKLLKQLGVGSLLVDPRLRAFAVFGFESKLGQGSVRSGAELLRELRGIKEEHELALLRKANELTQAAIVACSLRLEPGHTGADISALMHAALKSQGLRRTWALCLVGPAAALPHGGAEQPLLSKGDVVLIDTGGSLHGYQSDITRSWVFGGKPSAEVQRVWNTVRDAQQRAFDAMQPGVTCASIDRVARSAIERAGYGRGYSSFTHRLGHGIGMEGHEEPYFDGGSKVICKPGMTFSNEPGIYLPGRFGVRIEDIVAITDDGAEHFGSWQKGPQSPA